MNIVLFSTSSTLEKIQQLMKFLLCFGNFRASFGELVKDNQVEKITAEIDFLCYSLMSSRAFSSVLEVLCIKDSL